MCGYSRALSSRIARTIRRSRITRALKTLEGASFRPPQPPTRGEALTVGCEGAPQLRSQSSATANFVIARPGGPATPQRLGSELEPARALRAGFLESSPRGVLNVPRWAPKGALYPTRCHRTLLASDLFALSESRGRAQVSIPQPRTQRARALPRSGSSQFMP